MQPSGGVADQIGIDMGESTRHAVCEDCGNKIENVGKRGVLPKRCASCNAALARLRALPSGEYTVGPNGQYDAPDGHRTCRLCKVTMPVTKFRVRNKAQGTYRTECYECFKAAMRARYHAAPEKHRDRMRRTNYGLPLGEYDQMHATQDGRCAICGERETSLHSNGKPRQLFVDHHHATGKVRELLCMRCNMGVGQFRDDPSLLVKAIEYLNKHGAM